MAIRYEFPPVGSPSYLDGECDGWEYKISFRAGTLQKTYEMILDFLKEEGYADVPVPKDAEELKLFREASLRQRQLGIFDEVGYIHNPIKIIFPNNPKFRNMLTLCLYNEQEPQHLLRFYGVV